MKLKDQLPPNQCIATNKKGWRCRNAAMTGGQLCVVHDERTKEQTLTAITKATNDRMNKPKKAGKLENLQDIIEIQKASILELSRKPSKSSKDFAALSALSNSLIRALKEKTLFDRLAASDARKNLLGK